MNIMAPLHQMQREEPSLVDQFSTDVIYGTVGNPSSPHLGWEETKGDRLPSKIASEVSRIAKSNMEELMKSESVRRLCEESATESTSEFASTCDFISHSDIEIGDLIGEGGFNNVYRCRISGDGISDSGNSSDGISSDSDKSGGTNSTKPKYDSDEFVIKVLKKEVIQNPNELALCAADIVKEGVLMAMLEHPHILKVRGICSSGTMAFQTARRHDSFFVMMDILNEPLIDRLRSWMRTDHRLKAFSLSQRAERKQQRQELFKERIKCATQVADALTYLHEHNILHRDIKPSNIGFDVDGNAKLFDFDSCRVLPDVYANGLFHLTRRVGTIRYMAPEVALGKPYNLKADVYSYALLLYAIIGMKEPYIAIPGDEQEDRVFVSGERPKIKSKWPQVVQDLLKSMWQEDCQQRPSMEFIFESLKTIAP
jgi:serine/threonine protein kinase